MPRPTLKLDLSVLPKPQLAAPASSGEGAPAAGARVGFHAEYNLGTALGSGSTAVVKRGTRRADGGAVAVKCLFSSDEEVHQFAHDEYELLRSLQHPSIVRAEAIHTCGCRLWMVMELCEDGNVQSYVSRRGPLSESSSLLLMRQAWEGVNYLHQRRVVHRDLKPDNLLLKQDASVLKITDFNSAKVVGCGMGSSAMLTDRGTRGYTAPELLLGHHWNERVDIWASGLCLFFMVRGRIPFNSEDKEVKEVFAAGRLPQISWEGLSSGFEDLVRQCLAVNLNERPPAMKLLVHPLCSEREQLGFFGSLASSSWLDILAREFCCSKPRGVLAPGVPLSAASSEPPMVAPTKPAPAATATDDLTYRYSVICCSSRGKSRALSMPELQHAGPRGGAPSRATSAPPARVAEEAFETQQ